MRSKAYCDECGGITTIRNSRFLKNKFLCGKCYRKHRSIIRLPSHNYFSLEKALSKTYKIRVQRNKKKKTFFGIVTFPQILIGHKVKVILRDGKHG